MKKNTIQKQNIGNSGEYYFASRLSAKDFISTITLGRAEKIDIIAISPKGRNVKISIKTRFKEKAKNFPLSKKDETGGDKSMFYAFIRLNEFKKEPDIWIIPSLRVNELLKNAHKKYLSILGRNNQQRADVDLRQMWVEINKRTIELFPINWEKELTKYRNNFHQLF